MGFIFLGKKNNPDNPVVRFAVFTDLHHSPDAQPYEGRYPMDALKKLKQLEDTVKTKNVDFLIQLGDLSNDNNRSSLETIVNAVDQIPVPNTYHVTGNHDFDHKQTFYDVVGIQRAYYSFDVGNYRFIALDIFDDGAGEGHNTGGYRIDQAQYEWLYKIMNSTDKKFVFFSHSAMADLGGLNVNEFLNGYKDRVVMCLAGHSHEEMISEEVGIPRIRLEAMTDDPFPAGRFYIFELTSEGYTFERFF